MLGAWPLARPTGNPAMAHCRVDWYVAAATTITTSSSGRAVRATPRHPWPADPVRPSMVGRSVGLERIHLAKPLACLRQASSAPAPSRSAASALFRQRRVPPRLTRRECSQRAPLFPALRAPHPLRHIIEPSIPATQSAERVGFSRALVPTGRTLENQRVLTKLVAQLIDTKFARHAANCSGTAPARPSSTWDSQTLYECFFISRARASCPRPATARQARLPTQQTGAPPLSRGPHGPLSCGSLARSKSAKLTCGK